MECDSDLIFSLLERAKCLVLKYIKEFDLKSFLRATQILEHKAPKNHSATFFNLEKVLYNYPGYLFIRVIRVLLCTDRVLLLYIKRNFLHVL